MYTPEWLTDDSLLSAIKDPFNPVGSQRNN